MDGWREGKCGGMEGGKGRGAIRGLSGSSKYLYCIMIRAGVKERDGERHRKGQIECVHPLINFIPDR